MPFTRSWRYVFRFLVSPQTWGEQIDLGRRGAARRGGRPYMQGCSARVELQADSKTVARTRTTKKLAQRIDLNYFKRPTPLKRAKFWLSLLLLLLALIWITWRGFSGDHRVYSSGRMSKAHAVLEKECAACHLQLQAHFPRKRRTPLASTATTAPSITLRKRQLHRARRAIPNTAGA